MRSLLVLLLMLLALPARAELSDVAGHPPAPDFALPDANGGTVRLKDLRGKAVVVNFWATWCPPCRAEMPSLQRAAEALDPETAVVLGIHVGGSMDEVWSYAAEHGLSFPLLLDQDSAVADAWPMRGLPTTFVVGPAGKLVYQAVGAREWDDPQILDAVRALVTKN